MKDISMLSTRSSVSSAFYRYKGTDRAFSHHKELRFKLHTGIV